MHFNGDLSASRARVMRTGGARRPQEQTCARRMQSVFWFLRAYARVRCGPCAPPGRCDDGEGYKALDLHALVRGVGCHALAEPFADDL